MVGLFTVISPSLGGELKPGCFDFSKKVEKPLKEPIEWKDKTLTLGSGKLEDEVIWGAGRGILNVSVETIYQWLLDHYHWKDPNTTTLKTIEERRPGYRDFHTVQVNLNPFPLISIDWVEEWGYEVLKGTFEKPEKALISYQKKSGTSHLKHLCGSIVLTSLGPNKTDAFFYEENLASRLDIEGILKMHRSNFSTLGKLGTENKDHMGQTPAGEN